MPETFSIKMIKELLDEAINNGIGERPAYVRLGKDTRKDIRFLNYQVGKDGYLEIICEKD